MELEKQSSTLSFTFVENAIASIEFATRFPREFSLLVYFLIPAEITQRQQHHRRRGSKQGKPVPHGKWDPW
jgi:hypothetical protein